MTDLATALALVLVVEGCLWALFPNAMKRAAERSMALPSSTLRIGGLAFVIVGVAAVWMIRG